MVPSIPIIIMTLPAAVKIRHSVLTIVILIRAEHIGSVPIENNSSSRNSSMIC